ncbi:MAG: DsbE family thiol:disulfide interchange protein [Alphaproteobacteria bacterium]|nr:MAG: DsbE family thiol:disulfide interchange protein [Alphaproteobacteria bacterium]
MKRLGFYMPIALFAGIVVYLAIGLTLDPNKLPSMLIDKPVPEFVLPAIEGFDQGLSSSDLKGKVSLVNIWGSWCVACIIEHPLLMELAKNNTITIYGIDWKDPPGAGAAWLLKEGNPYTLIGDDADGRVAIDFGVTGAPETFIADKDGRIRYKYIGPITPEVWNEIILPIVEELQR